MNNKKKGFTLVELIVVIAIIAVLAAVAVPVTIVFVNKAKKNKELSEVNSLASAVEARVAEKIEAGYDAPDKVTDTFKKALEEAVQSTGSKQSNYDRLTLKITKTNAKEEDNGQFRVTLSYTLKKDTSETTKTIDITSTTNLDNYTATLTVNWDNQAKTINVAKS